MTDEKKKPEVKEAKPKRSHKDDKIFNNSYHHGDNLPGDDYKVSQGLKVDNDYADSYLGDIYNPEDNMSYKIVRQEMMWLFENNDYMVAVLIETDDTQKKFNKEKVNNMFEIVKVHFADKPEKHKFLNYVYVFDILSNTTGIKYKNLFDLLEYQYKALLIKELDDSHDILSKGFAKFKRMY